MGSIPVGGATLLKGSRNGYLFSLPCRDSATATALRFFHRVILSVVEIRAKRGSNGTKCHSGSRWKKIDSLQRGLTMKENFLVDLSKQFAVDIVNLCTDIKENRKSNVLLNQVLRSGTSIGANIHEANYAASKTDFINKFQIALKECYETDYWLGLFKDTHTVSWQRKRTLIKQ